MIKIERFIEQKSFNVEKIEGFWPNPRKVLVSEARSQVAAGRKATEGAVEALRHTVQGVHSVHAFYSRLPAKKGRRRGHSLTEIEETRRQC